MFVKVEERYRLSGISFLFRMQCIAPDIIPEYSTKVFTH